MLDSTRPTRPRKAEALHLHLLSPGAWPPRHHRGTRSIRPRARHRFARGGGRARPRAVERLARHRSLRLGDLATFSTATTRALRLRWSPDLRRVPPLAVPEAGEEDPAATMRTARSSSRPRATVACVQRGDADRALPSFSGEHREALHWIERQGSGPTQSAQRSSSRARRTLRCSSTSSRMRASSSS